jgi:hypothetical protein
VSNKIQKKINLVRAIEILQYAASKRMLICLYFMLAHYCDTKETMQETCELIKELVTKYEVDATLHYNTPYPGTYQYKYSKELGISFISQRYSDFVGYRPLIQTENITVEEQLELFTRTSPYLNNHNFEIDI